MALVIFHQLIRGLLHSWLKCGDWKDGDRFTDFKLGWNTFSTTFHFLTAIEQYKRKKWNKMRNKSLNSHQVSHQLCYAHVKIAHTFINLLASLKWTEKLLKHSTEWNDRGNKQQHWSGFFFALARNLLNILCETALACNIWTKALKWILVSVIVHVDKVQSAAKHLFYYIQVILSFFLTIFWAMFDLHAASDGFHAKCDWIKW